MALTNFGGRYYDYSTTNTSFVDVSKKLAEMGVKNNNFMLEVKNPRVHDLDPFSDSLTDEEKMLIMKECTENVFYFLREIVLIKTPGGENVKYQATEAGLTRDHLALNCFDTVVTGTRQTHKTVDLCCFLLWVFLFNTKEDIALVNRNVEVSKDMVSTIMAGVYSNLPAYMKDIFADRGLSQSVCCVGLTNSKITIKEVPLEHGEIILDSERHKEFLKRLDEFSRHLNHPVIVMDDIDYIPNGYRIIKESETVFYHASEKIRYDKKYNVEETKIEKTETGRIYCRALLNTEDSKEPEHKFPTKEEYLNKLDFDRRAVEWDPFYLDVSVEEFKKIMEEEKKIGFNGFIKIKQD